MTSVTITGDIAADSAITVFNPLAANWPRKKIKLPKIHIPPAANKSQLYFIDIPGARQSEIRVGNQGLRAIDHDYYPAQVMNYKLGASFNGNINMVLREEKVYTYGARTEFNGSTHSGHFRAYTAVRSDATIESINILRDEMRKYRQPVSPKDLQFTKEALIKANARRFETLAALMEVLADIASHDYPFDYISQQDRIIRKMTVGEHHRLAQEYIDPGRMIYLVVGDGESLLSGLENLGLGQPIFLDTNGRKINPQFNLCY